MERQLVVHTAGSQGAGKWPCISGVLALIIIGLLRTIYLDRSNGPRLCSTPEVSPEKHIPDDTPLMSTQPLPAAPSSAVGRVQRILRLMGLDGDAIWTYLLDEMRWVNSGKAIVVEVGSFDGAQAVEAIARGYRVHIYEPSTSNRAKVQRKLDAYRQNCSNPCNPYEPVLHSEAVSNRSGDAVFWKTAQGATTDHLSLPSGIPDYTVVRKRKGWSRSTVKMVRLDDEFTDPIYILKIDTQGHDGLVLQGMERLLRAQKVFIVLFEFWPRAMLWKGSDGRKALELLDSCGYDIMDLRMELTGWRRKQQTANIPLRMRIDRPTDFNRLTQYIHQIDKRFGNKNGFWFDVVAVARNADLNHFV
eukprot:NODE_3571_length_1198_cov_52.801860_g3391_i0.p1 GENE.NODE_3571_length_1198_cov_52.801860_g3391_i0~~NODE_3571_length_1198_cov_52.801860_g3391_i0.p1  ORF type:complete len:360 (-),score=32.83 NODE_3571_length_1198_cov_52.801860_g3391_i0:67-1146(-)